MCECACAVCVQYVCACRVRAYVCACVCVCVLSMIGVWENTILKVLFAELNANVAFVMSCLRGAVSLTRMALYKNNLLLVSSDCRMFQFCRRVLALI